MRFLTAGESHGQGLTVIVEGVPVGVTLTAEVINHNLARRQVGYGRGGRMVIERDQVQILSGVRFEKTTGAPITLFIENKDWANWQAVMAVEGARTPEAEAKRFVRPRPGHADLAAYYKYGFDDLRDALERSSARETAARVAAGAVAKAVLEPLGVHVFSHLLQLGGVSVESQIQTMDWPDLEAKAETNDLRCGADEATLSQIRKTIDAARKAGTTLGGKVEVVATGVPAGLGSYVHWDRRLDGQLAQALMSIQAVKSVSIGLGEDGSTRAGHEFHDGIEPSDTGFKRSTNRAGGLEAGVTNGESVIARAVMKPIATLLQPLPSVNLETGEAESAHFERSDVTAVPACGVVCEAMTAFVLANAVLAKYGEDTLDEILQHHQYSQTRQQALINRG